MLCWPALRSCKRTLPRSLPAMTKSATSAKAILASMKDVSSKCAPGRVGRRGGRQRVSPGGSCCQAAGERYRRSRSGYRGDCLTRRNHSASQWLTDENRPGRRPIFRQTVLRLSRQILMTVLEDLLVFQLAGEPFGLRLTAVAEIIRPPDLAHMPLVPPSLLGLANLRGIVMPVVSLRALLHLPDVATDRSTRVIVVRGDNPVGFVVDGIRRLLAVATDQLEKDDAGADADGSSTAGRYHQRRRRRKPDQAVESVASSARAIRSARYFFDAGRKPDIARQKPACRNASESADLAVELLSRPAGICFAH